jgi:hypothetical protein
VADGRLETDCSVVPDLLFIRQLVISQSPFLMPTELINELGRVYLQLEYDAKNRWVSINWIGEQSYASILAGADAGLDYIRDNACCCLLNDNRQITGSWSEHAVEWAVANWAPRAIQAGLTHMANVVSPESLAAIYAEVMHLDLAERLQVRQFNTMALAQAWLHEAQAPKP